MRANICRFGLAAIVLVLTGTASTSAQVLDARSRRAGSDWAGFLGPQRNGKTSEMPIIKKWSPGGLRVRWSREVGEGYSMSVVSQGRLFHFDRHGNRARLTCMKSESGEELWRSEYRSDYEDYYDFSDGPRASPLVDGDRVYVFGVEGVLRCHRVADGRLLWSVDTAKEFGVVQNFFGVGSTPIVEGDLLIVQVGGSPPDSPQIHSGRVLGAGSGIVAFDKYTGRVQYKITDELASYSSPTVVNIGDRRWGFVFARGGLVAFEPISGRIDFFYPWRARSLESINASNPVIVNDMVLISEAYGRGSSLLRVRPGDYEVIWKDSPGPDKSLQTHWSTPVYHEGYVYACSGSGGGDAQLRAIDFATGKVMWSQPGLGRTTMLYADGHLIVLTEHGRLLLVKATPERYELVARAPEPVVEYPAWNPPILSHGLLYVHGKNRLVSMRIVPGRVDRR